MAHAPDDNDNNTPADSALPLLETALAARHRALGARMVPFAGYAMPVQYADGIMAEHLWTREHAGLFDVSHMGMYWLGGADLPALAEALEHRIPADVAGLAPGQIRYSQLLNDDGGIIDDLMVSLPVIHGVANSYFLVLNAGRKHIDAAYIQARLPAGMTLSPYAGRSLIALQGPQAWDVLAERLHNPAAVEAELDFMTCQTASIRIGAGEGAGVWANVLLSRCGYTGEDGVEMAVADSDAPRLWDALLADPRVKPVGLGARDSLRLEAGLCLYGADIDETTSPVEADLTWSIPKKRRVLGGFPGSSRIKAELIQGPKRKRVGLTIEGRQPARAHTPIHTPHGGMVGEVTSGGFAPSLEAPIAMGYVDAAHAAPGTALHLMVRGKAIPARVAKLPFVPNRFYRKPKA